MKKSRASRAAKAIPEIRRRQKDRRAETRLKLLHSAAHTIYEMGYARASIGEIVKRAGLTKGAHLHHFRTKEQLMAETIEFLFSEVRAEQERLPRVGPITIETMEQRFEESADAIFDWRFVAILELWMASRTEPLLHEPFVESQARHIAQRRLWHTRVYGEEVVEQTHLLPIVEGMAYVLRGVFLEHILGHDRKQNPTWFFWRRVIAEMVAESVKEARQQRDGRKIAAS